MGEGRLSPLLMIYYHQDIALDYDEIEDLYARRPPQKDEYYERLF